MTLDIDHLASWIGNTETIEEVLSPQLVRRFNATLGMDASTNVGDPAPLMIHFCLAQPALPEDQLGPDGHPRRGGFLPPVPLPRRMWAGGEITFEAPLMIGGTITRSSTIQNVEQKTGNSGALCFVTVQHDISCDGKPALREYHNIVYRDPPAADADQAAAPAAKPAPVGLHSHMVETTPTMLFRYSAITFNGHRIHYDAPYARAVEGYDGLVVHGPIQATLMAHMAARTRGRIPARFSYRGKSPLFVGTPFSVNGAETDDGMSLWTAASGGPIAMQAQASW